MNRSHVEPTGVRNLYPIPVVEVSEDLVGEPTPRLEVTVTNKGSTRK